MGKRKTPSFGLAPVSREVKLWSTLAGKCFHAFTTDLPREGRGVVDRQGTVLLDLGSGYFLVQYFEMAGGYPSSKHVVHMGTMASNGWEFYESDTEMRERYEQYYARALREATVAEQG